MHCLTAISRLTRSARPFPTLGKMNYMNGAGSRSTQNRWKDTTVMSFEKLKVHYDLLPIIVIIGFAVVYPTAYCIRLATKATDVTWRKEEQPYEDYVAKEYKLINSLGNEKEASTPSPRPNYRD